MSIAIRCPACQTSYRVNARLAGKRVKCRSCGKAVRVGAAVEDGGENKNAAVAPVEKSEAKRPAGHRVFAVLAVLVVAGFGVAVFYVGQYVGWWGQLSSASAPASRVQIAEDPAAQRLRLTQLRLRQIGQGLEMWAHLHKGNYPQSLGMIQEVAELPPSTFETPFKAGESYVYLYFKSMGVAMPRKTVVSYDPAELAVNGSTHVLYADGEVTMLDAAELTREVNRSEAVRTGAAPAAIATGKHEER